MQLAGADKRGNTRLFHSSFPDIPGLANDHKAFWKMSGISLIEAGHRY